MIVFKAHPKAIYDLAFSPDGQFLLTSGGDESVRLWSLQNIEVEQVRDWPGSSFWAPIAFSPSGRFVARGGYGVRVWPTQGAVSVVSSRNSEAILYSNEFSQSVCFSPDEKVLAAHGDSSTLRWGIPSGEPLPGGWGGTRESNDGQQFPTGPLAYSPDGALLATCFGVLGKRGYDSAIYLWKAESGELCGTLRTDFASAHPTVVRFSPNGSFLAGIYGPGLRIWDVSAEKEVAAREVGKKHFKGLAFTPNGERLLTVSNDETVRLWDTRTWSEVGGFEWKIGKLAAVAADPYGCRMATGGANGKVLVWDAS